MKYFFLSFLCLFSLFFLKPIYASYDPLSVPNNKIGVHILFPSELPDAAKLINSSGGDWGYVTIPIQARDKDLKKWQLFMDQAKQLHIIPILRLASEGDYFNTSAWRKLTLLDMLDFANFLDSLNWPTKNRYIIVANEPNRGDEWGGSPHPDEYAKILSYATTVFKLKNPDFFVISAGLDNAAANTSIAINEYSYLRQMETAVPGIFNQIDGIGSHAYPNPAFAQPPEVQNAESIASFKYERDLISQFTTKNLPVFITETGWSTDAVSDSQIASYYQQAFSSVWNDSKIVTVTPFLLNAGGGPFTQFSLLKNGTQTLEYLELLHLPKVKGLPSITSKVLAAEITTIQDLPVKTFFPTHHSIFQEFALQVSKITAKFLLGIQ